MTRVLRDGRVYRGDMGASARKAHRTRRQHLLDSGETLTKRTFGVEIEYHSEYPVTKLRVAEAIERALGEHVHVTGYHSPSCLRCVHTVRYDKWKIEHDGSLGGRGHGLDSTTGEVVSPVLTGQAGLATLKIVMKAIKDAGGTISARCGFHVHIGVRDLDRDSLGRLVKKWIRKETEIYSLIPRGRRANTYCQPWTRKYRYNSDPASLLSIAQTALMGGRTWDKYTGLNLAPYGRIGTVEFRLHGGTLNFKKAEAWIQFLLGFADASVDATDAWETDSGPVWDYLVREKYLPQKSGRAMAERQQTYQR